MNKEKLLEWLKEDEKILNELVDKARANGDAVTFYQGNLNYIEKLKSTIDKGLFDE